MNLIIKNKIRAIAIMEYNIPSKYYLNVFKAANDSYLVTYTDSHDTEHKHIITL